VSIKAFQSSERDPVARALAVRLEIEEKDREASGAQESRAAHHAEPVAPNAVHQHDDTATGLPPDKPAAQCRSRGRRNRNLLSAKIVGRGANLCPHRRREEETHRDDSRRECRDPTDNYDCDERAQRAGESIKSGGWVWLIRDGDHPHDLTRK